MGIAYKLLPHIHISELKRAERKAPQSMNAYDPVLQGMYRLYRLGHDDMLAARRLFENALEHDPEYATAYALMAKWYILYIGEGHSTDFEADSHEALRLASRKPPATDKSRSLPPFYRNMEFTYQRLVPPGNDRDV